MVVPAIVQRSRRFLPSLLVLLALSGPRPGRAQDATVRDDLTPSPAPRSAAVLGEWVEGKTLRFRVDAIRSCGVSSTAVGTALARVAFTVQIIAGPGEIFVSPRDVTLEAGGVILQTVIAPGPLGNHCGNVLMPKRLPARQSMKGRVVFEVSPEFKAGKTDLILAYRPTRWGGAGRLEVKVPACLEACKERSQ